MSWMRANAKWLMIATIGLFILGFTAAELMRNYFGPQRSRYLATINGKQVTMNRYLEIVSQQETQFLENNQPPITQDKRDEIRQRAFRILVNRILLQQALSREGGGALDREIRRFFERQFMNKKGTVNPQLINQQLRRMSTAQRQRMARETRHQIERMRMANWVQSRISFSETEARKVMRNGLTETNLYGVFVAPESFVSDTRVRAFYQRNQSRYMGPRRMLLRQIFLPHSDTAPQSKSGLDQLKETINSIRRRHKAGDSFAVLARQYSADTTTASRGGLRGWVTPEELPGQLARVAFGTDTGEISNLARTDRGFYLFYPEAGPIQEPRPLSEVKSNIQSTLLSDTHWNQARRRVKELRRDILNQNNPFSALKEAALLHSTSDFSSPRAGDYGWVPLRYVVPELHPLASAWQGEIARQQLIDPAIFRAVAELEPGVLSEPVRSDFGYHLLMYEDTRPPRTAELSDSTRRQLRTFVGRRKSGDFLTRWLEMQRRESTIQLSVDKSRIGGSIPWKNSESPTG